MVTRGHRWRALVTRVVRRDGAWTWSVAVTFNDDVTRIWRGERKRREYALAAVRDRIERLASERS